MFSDSEFHHIQTELTRLRRDLQVTTTDLIKLREEEQHRVDFVRRDIDHKKRRLEQKRVDTERNIAHAETRLEEYRRKLEASQRRP